MGKRIQKCRTMYSFEYNEDTVSACPAVALILRKPKRLCYDFHSRSTKALKCADTVYCSSLFYPSCQGAGSSPRADLATAVLFRDVAMCLISQLNFNGNRAWRAKPGWLSRTHRLPAPSLPLASGLSPCPLLTLSGL